MMETQDPKETVVVVEEKPLVTNDLSTNQETKTDEPPAANQSEVIKKARLQTMATAGNSLGAIIVSFVIGLIVPVLQLIIGWIYADRCPINPKIPKYLIWGGGLGILCVILNQVRAYISLKATKTTNGESGVAPASAMNKPLYNIISVIVTCLTIFLFCWFIAGCTWIFRVWNEVKYYPESHPAFCQAILYRFAYILLILPIVFLFVCCCFPVCLGCLAVFAVANQRPESVPTTAV